MSTGGKLEKANLFIRAGRLVEASAVLEAILSKKPHEARALHMLGVLRAQRNELAEAEKLLLRARDAAPRSPTLLTDLAALLVNQNRHAEALPHLEAAVRLEPTLKLAMFYRGAALMKLGGPQQALPIFEKLAAIEPGNALYQQNLASLLLRVGRDEEAEPIVDRILASNFHYPPATLLKGVIAMHRGRFDAAIEIFDAILARDPDDAETASNRGFVRLLRGEMELGWSDYESRLRGPDAPTTPANLDVPHWSGEDLKGRSILVYAEQGIGDTFMCFRYFPLLVERGAKVFFLVSSSLWQLLRSSCREVHFTETVPVGEHLDFQIPLMSLPFRFQTTLQTIPATVPYLAADPHKVEYWGQVIGKQGFKIGINWQGNPRSSPDYGRSIPLREFLPLACLPGVRLISLQKLVGLDQLDSLPSGMTVETLDSSGTDGFIDTSAVMANMDLIISSDTSVANLAGAMGCRAWIVLKKLPDWRWMLDRADCFWYPTVRLFRQNDHGRWSDVFEAMAAEVAQLTVRTTDYASFGS